MKFYSVVFESFLRICAGDNYFLVDSFPVYSSVTAKWQMLKILNVFNSESKKLVTYVLNVTSVLAACLWLWCVVVFSYENFPSVSLTRSNQFIRFGSLP